MTFVLFDREQSHWQDSTWGVFLGVSYAPTASQVQANFGGSLLFMHTPFAAELPKFDVVTHGEGA